MKLLKYILFLFAGLLAVQSYAQPDTRRMNISIGIFSPSATAYDFEGAIGVVGSTGYTVDDIEPGDMFWDDASRYRVDSIEVIVAGTSATVWVTDLYSAGAPQSGKGTLGKPSPNLGLQPLTENGSNFITEAQEAKILTDNLMRIDSLGGDGNGIISALPSGDVVVDAATNNLHLDNMSSVNMDAPQVSIGETDTGVGNETKITITDGSANIDLKANLGVTFTNSNGTFEFPTTRPGNSLSTGSQKIISWFNDDASGFNDYLQSINTATGDITQIYWFGDANSSQAAFYSSDVMGEYTAEMGTYTETDWTRTHAKIKVDDVNTGKTGQLYVYNDSASFRANDILALGTFSPSGSVTVGSPGKNWITTNSGVTNILAEGVAKGNLIVSGASSLPSSLSHIQGPDTAQVIVRAAGGVGLKATRYIDLQADSVFFGGFLASRFGVSNDLRMSNTEGRWDIQQAGSAGLLNIFAYDSSPSDPIGMFINGTTGSVVIGDRDSDIHGGKFTINATGFLAEAGYTQFLKSDGDITVMGDAEDENWGLILQDGFTDFGGFSNSDLGLFIDNDLNDDNKTIFLGRKDREQGIAVEDLDGLFSIRIGDPDNTNLNPSLDVLPSGIQLNSRDGDPVAITGTSYSYTLPVTTPTAADSLDRAPVWRQGNSGFKVVNDGDFRTINTTGNILPYDDIVEVIQGITVHLPAPSVTYQGKIYHIIAGGTVSVGTPSTIDVVDGSSTIELGPSLTLDNAFEVYTLTCNGSQWIVLNNKP